ncbi:hypothetical protein HGA91_03425 [candidate division WWE3 bacterium]|nr:hypothetical protein [candidate division WWE3 bacterium]
MFGISHKKNLVYLFSFVLLILQVVFVFPIKTQSAAQLSWQQLSSQNGQIPSPNTGNQQTASLILDVDHDGDNDFIIAERTQTPAVVWYRRDSTGWTKLPIETSRLSVEAGGAFHDIDSDGDLDIVFGGDYQSNQIWWWENPYPTYSSTQGWTRRTIKNSGSNQHHDQIFGDFTGDGKAELVSWNQLASKLILFDIPSDPKTATTWPSHDIYSWSGGNALEGLSSADIDLDGKTDIVGGGRWFKHSTGYSFASNTIDDSLRNGRIVTGQLITGGRPEVVIGCGDCDGPLRMFNWNGTGWQSTVILSTIVHGHSLQIIDVDSDNLQDIFAAEMRLDGGNNSSRALIFYGNGQGSFTQSSIISGIDNHESKMADLDRDGDVDLLSKPYNYTAPGISIFLNSGTSSGKRSLDSWTRRVIDTNEQRNIFIDAQDLTGDGKKDIIVGNKWYRNPGTASGNWTASGNENIIGTPLNQFTLAYDVDSDGDIDLVGTQGNGSDSNANFAWAQNSGSGTFTIRTNIAAAQGDFLQGHTIGRFTNNGALEIALSWHQDGVGVQMLTIPTSPTTTQWAWKRISTTSQDEALSMGDIDRDGDQDLLMGTRWLRNDGTSWSTQTLSNDTGLPDRNQLIDLNNDGRLDAIIGYEAISIAGKLAWYEQPTTSTSLWTEHIISQSAIGPMSMECGDMDNDSDVDVVVGEHNLTTGSTPKLYVFENNGNGASWISHTVYTGDEHHDGAQISDIDNDGDMDILSIGWGHNRIHLYENTSSSAGITPTGTPSTSITPTGASHCQPLGDLDCSGSISKSEIDQIIAGIGGTTALLDLDNSGHVNAIDYGIAYTNYTSSSQGTNIIQNGDFNNNKTNWTFYTNGTGSYDIASNQTNGNAAQLTLTTIGDNTQLYQSDLPLSPATRYRLTFQAYSTSGNDLSVALIKHSTPFTNYGLSNFTPNVSTQWQTFTTEFTTAGFSGEVNDGRLRFFMNGLASNGDRYFIDSIQLVRADGYIPSNTPSPSTSSTVTPTTTVTPTPSNTQALGPKPGDIYKEFTLTMTGNENWRVTDPNATAAGASEFIPNPILNINIDDLNGAIRAEGVLDRWGGHTGTTNKQVRFNNNSWITVPEVTTTPAGTASTCYMSQFNPVFAIPLTNLKQGNNTYEGTSGPQGDGCPNNFGWGQWGQYALIVRVYYDSSKSHPTGTVTSPSANQTITENPTVQVSASSAANRIDILAKYEGYDENGDGIYNDWHDAYFRDVAGNPIQISRIVGTDTSTPYSATWDTTWVPDQPVSGISFVARIRDTSGVWYVSPIVNNITLSRPTQTVKLYKPENVPTNYWVRAGKTQSSNITIPSTDDLSKLVQAGIHLRTWNGINERFSLNGNSITMSSAANHHYAYTTHLVTNTQLRNGQNTITFTASTEEHGVEIHWPGPGLIVRYNK